MADFFIGVDGGATKSIIRLEDDQGKLLGRITSGPASVRNSVAVALHSIEQAITQLLQAQAIGRHQPNVRLFCGMGLAGWELADAQLAFYQGLSGYTKVMCASDAHIACLGAHGGRDGSIIIIGTGIVGLKMQQMKPVCKVSGWGFPYDDEGCGAWLGMSAIGATLKAYDGRAAKTLLSEMIGKYFAANYEQLVHWAVHANSQAFATLAPLVFAAQQAGCQLAAQLLTQAAQAIVTIAATLAKDVALPLVLLGGIAQPIADFLPAALRSSLKPCQLPPDAGAILLIQQELKHA